MIIKLCRHKNANRWLIVGGIDHLPDNALLRLKSRLHISKKGNVTIPMHSWIGVNIKTDSRTVNGLENFRYAIANIYNLK